MLFYDKTKKRRAADQFSGSTTLQSNSARSTRRTMPARHNSTGNTHIQNCLEEELARYFELLEGQPPNDLYRMVMSQVEHTLISYVLAECGNNQSRAAEYLGISRGTLRNKLIEKELI